MLHLNHFKGVYNNNNNNNNNNNKLKSFFFTHKLESLIFENTNSMYEDFYMIFILFEFQNFMFLWYLKYTVDES
jgi:hypothetical protein